MKDFERTSRVSAPPTHNYVPNSLAGSKDAMYLLIGEPMRKNHCFSTAKGTRYLQGTWYLLLHAPCSMLHALLFASLFFTQPLIAEEPPLSEQPVVAEATGERMPVVLKMMVVNPSDKYAQTFPLKAYLPAEIKPEHIIDKEDLDVVYDAEANAYYVSREIELKPGESVVKVLKIQDVWFIPDKELENKSEEATDLFGKLKNSRYEEQARLLLNNIEVLLLQITERQNDTSMTPQEHIAVYRENKGKLRDIEMDLMSLRRFVVVAGENSGLPSIGKSSDQSGMPAFIAKLSATTQGSKKGGTVPGWVLWRVIFTVLGFTGFMSLVFVWVWQRQVNIVKQRHKMSDKEEDQNLPDLRLGDFLGPAIESGSSTTKNPNKPSQAA